MVVGDTFSGPYLTPLQFLGRLGLRLNWLGWGVITLHNQMMDRPHVLYEFRPPLEPEHRRSGLVDTEFAFEQHA